MKLRNYFIPTIYGDISVTESGKNGPPILFIHGNSSCKEVFEYQLDYFSSKYRVIAFDLPGHGKSEDAKVPENTYTQPSCAKIGLEILSVCKASNAFVVGWSLGGHIGIEMAYRNPNLSGLILTGTPPCGPGTESVNSAFTPLPHMGFTSKNVFTQKDAESYAKYTLSLHKPIPSTLIDMVKRTDGRAREILWRNWTDLNQGCPQIDVLECWDNPVAVIQGSNEAFFDNKYFDRINFKNLWEKKIHLIPETGHAPFLESPEHYNEILERFLVTYK